MRIRPAHFIYSFTEHVDMTVCSICLQCKQPNEMQKLPCSHMFCRGCISKCSASQLCPLPCCTYIRHVNVIIDEADEGDEEIQKISFGQKLPSMLQLEERQRCDGRKEELPCCPIFRCANRLTKNEIAKISERAPHMRQVCARLIEASPDDSPEEPPGKDECVFFCSVYQSENSTKPIIFPLACTVFDMVNQSTIQ
uniref:RING-type domain-containing protein n=1 Tax=Brugia malayi TaxID=6279 RepID=A0A8L7TEX6_BRUMA